MIQSEQPIKRPLTILDVGCGRKAGLARELSSNCSSTSSSAGTAAFHVISTDMGPIEFDGFDTESNSMSSDLRQESESESSDSQSESVSHTFLPNTNILTRKGQAQL